MTYRARCGKPFFYFLSKSGAVQHPCYRLSYFLIASGVGAQPVDPAQPGGTLRPVVVEERYAPRTADVLGLGDAPLARTPASATVIDAAQISAAAPPAGRPGAV